jgi:membrane-bound serine protease (ClpP class)
MRRPTSIRAPGTGAFGILMALVILTSAAVVSGASALSTVSRTPALGLQVSGAIGPATALYIQHGLEVAQQRRSPLVILEIDTPGGLMTSMRAIISSILASSVPIVAYVAPSGARAASAGTYILYACHFAAMAPATNLGAATPVSIGGSEPATTLSAEQRKVLNDSIAYIRGLAQLRGRNADWAEQAVRGAASLPATQALQQHVIDFIAPDLTSLLTQLNGRTTHIGEQTVRLDTGGVRVDWMKPDWRTRLLAIITDPEIAYGLLLIGIWGLLFEGYHPGGVLPGVVGVVSLLVALFAFQLLPTNFAGLALLFVGAGMIAAEFFFPAYGSLGIGGLIAFIVGSLILFSGNSGIQVALPLIGGFATVGGLVILGIVHLANRARRAPVATGTAAMLGAVVQATEDFVTRGRVRYGGELWNATSAAPLKAGQQARVVKVEGLTLWVEPLQ